MTDKEETLVLDILSVSRTLVAELVQYQIPTDYELSMTIPDLTIALTEALSGSVVNLIESSRSSLTRRPGQSISVDEPFIALCTAKLNLDSTFITTLVLENLSTNAMYAEVDNFLSDYCNFQIFTYQPNQGLMVIKPVGDWRVLQWEEDHMREGVYYADGVN